MDGCVGLCRDTAHDTAREDGLLALTMHYAAKAARAVNAEYAGPWDDGGGPPHQWTRLHHAARAGLADRARVLAAAAGARVNALDKDRRTALWHASRLNHVPVVAALLACPGVVVNASAPGKDARDVARHSVVSRVAVDAFFASLLADDRPGAFAFIRSARAAMSAHAAVVPTISPLAAAAGAGHAEVVAALLAWPGTDVNDGEQHRDNTALFCAASGGHVAVVEQLLARPGVSVQADASGQTPLSVASKHGHADVVRALLAFASTHDDDDASEDVSPLLFAAAEAGRVEIVRLLLAAPGVDVNVVGGNDSTPLRVARANGHAEVVELLEAAGGVE